jgi:hypothetical protein
VIDYVVEWLGPFAAGLIAGGALVGGAWLLDDARRARKGRS